MLQKIVDKVSQTLSGPSETETDQINRDQAIRSATAVLMVEVARSDYEYDESEFSLLLDLIVNNFHVSPEEAAELADEANQKSEELVSLHAFTHFLNKNLDYDDKVRVVSLLWQVAYADGRLDKFEDTLVLRISDLLYVSRGLVMSLKHRANPNAD